MFKILDKKIIGKGIKQLQILAPDIARKAKAGQFVVLVIDEESERIPLTLADWDDIKGTINLIFQEVGFTTRHLGELKIGDKIAHILGPLGKPLEPERADMVVCIGGGVGIAEVLPVTKEFKKMGNKVTGIIGSRNKDLLILQQQMSQICDELYITTDDGSYGQKGLVTDVLKDILTTSSQQPLTLVYTIGPLKMMKAVCELTRLYKIKTKVCVNPIMVDATGMCGSCRLTVGGKTVFGCVDGPEFDGHQVDFDELEKRVNLFREQERQILKRAGCVNRKDS
jgi:ferredoxin--NADP+ reductase